MLHILRHCMHSLNLPNSVYNNSSKYCYHIVYIYLIIAYNYTSILYKKYVNIGYRYR